MTEPRPQPHSLDAERAVLGAILVEPDALYAVGATLRPDHFFRPSHKRIYAALIAMSEAGLPIEFLTLKNQLQRRGELDEVGGAVYVASLADGTPKSVNIEHYARIVREHATLRDVIVAGSKMVEQAYLASEDSRIVIGEAERTLLDLTHDAQVNDLLFIGRTIPDTMATLEAIKTGRAVTGQPTGFRQLDEWTRGFHPGNLIVLGGRPGEGKSALALQLAIRVARDVPVAFFSMEMSRDEIQTRALAQEARVNHHAMMQGKLPPDEDARVARARDRLNDLPLAIDDTAALSPFQIRSKARKLQAQHGLGFVVVDYLQLLQRPRTAQSREESVAENTWALKMLAGELKVPVLALSQLNRASQSRDDKRPTLADLRESGAVGQTANVVFLIYKPPAESNGIVTSIPPVELLIAKQRNGPQHVSVDLVFVGEHMRFEERSWT
jgi:replicative DNA helicase